MASNLEDQGSKEAAFSAWTVVHGKIPTVDNLCAKLTESLGTLERKRFGLKNFLISSTSFDSVLLGLNVKS
jgi:hypothetical protein